MKIAKKFRKLTKYTWPHGTENGLRGFLPNTHKSDGLGNFYVQIGDNPSTMFTCHLDTATNRRGPVTHIRTGNFIKTDGTSILGADDKAGMVVLLNMIEHKIPGLYYFFIGEEVGCVGSRALAKKWNDFDFTENIKKVVSFDRRGTDSIITRQFYERTCSNEFALDLAQRLNSTGHGFKYKIDPTGIFTDSAEFSSLVPECTNVSVGYYNEHSVNEKQDICFLGRLCKAVCQIDWETLTVSRSTDNYDFMYEDRPDSNTSYSRYYDDNAYDMEDENDYELTWVNGCSGYFKVRGISSKMYISDQYIEREKKLIDNWLRSTDGYGGLIYTNILWNGTSLYVIFNEDYQYIGNRMELSNFIPELKSISMIHLKENLNG